MLRKKLSLILAATTLSFGLVACDSDDGDGDTGASASASGTSGGESDSDESDSDESETNETNESESETSNDTDDTSDDSTTDDSAGDDSTTDDTSSDPCEGIMCEEGEECVGGICVESDETDSGGGESDPNYPNPADGCAAPSQDGNNAGLNVCAPPCEMDVCPETSVGGMGVCGLGGTQTMEGPECTTDEECDTEAGFTCQELNGGIMACFQATHCVPLCTMGGECPDGMSCSMGVCVY